jgi:thioredoxin reductase (NADPH)
MEVRNVIIIGSGPAGLTAALYTSRANLNPLCFEGHRAGGQLMTTTEVENYPGFPAGIMGPALMDDMRKQAERFGTELRRENVEKVDFSRRPFRIQADSGEYLAHSIIISTGASPRHLELDREMELTGRGVSTCATCDGAFFRGEEILVVGGGDSAVEEANFLTRFGSAVTLIHRREELRASKIMQDRALKNPKMKFLWDSVVTGLLEGEGKLTGVRVKNLKSGSESKVPAGALFVAIGHVPNTELFKGQIDLDENGYILVQQGSTATNVPGVFAGGDCVDHVYRQAVTAAGMGCAAAIDCERWLAHHEDEHAAGSHAGHDAPHPAPATPGAR